MAQKQNWNTNFEPDNAFLQMVFSNCSSSPGLLLIWKTQVTVMMLRESISDAEQSALALNIGSPGSPIYFKGGFTVLFSFFHFLWKWEFLKGLWLGFFVLFGLVWFGGVVFVLLLLFERGSHYVAQALNL
jgi:hypothetical protein